jgi:hypothetical protein
MQLRRRARPTRRGMRHRMQESDGGKSQPRQDGGVGVVLPGAEAQRAGRLMQCDGGEGRGIFLGDEGWIERHAANLAQAAQKPQQIPPLQASRGCHPTSPSIAGYYRTTCRMNAPLEHDFIIEKREIFHEFSNP